MAPNIAKPTANPMTAATEKTLLRNRCSGSTGSGARRSTATNATSPTTASAAIAHTCTELHAQVVPPRLVSSTTAVEMVASRTMPA